MNDLAVVTPSYRPDAGLFAELHRSVLRHTSADTVHHVVVPPADRALFEPHEGPRCRIWTYPELLPKRYVGLPGMPGLWMNTLRPWPPVRGWVMQQAIKIAVTARLDAKVVLLADSDVVLVREPTLDRFVAGDGRLRLWRTVDGVHDGMPDHVRWHAVARELLGLPPRPELPLPDYISPLCYWDPRIVQAMQARIEQTTGRPWMHGFNSRLQISEFILYGVFVDEVYSRDDPPQGDSDLCHVRWSVSPMDEAEAADFADRLSPEAIGVMLSAKSSTPPEIRAEAVRRCAAAAQR